MDLLENTIQMITKSERREKIRNNNSKMIVRGKSIFTICRIIQNNAIKLKKEL